MQLLLGAAAMIGGMAFVTGLLLLIVSKATQVAKPPEAFAAVRAALPGSNCSACGYAGCDALAGALSRGETGVDACPVGGAETAARIAKLLNIGGVDEIRAKPVARVRCQGSKAACADRASYQGLCDCVSAALVQGGARGCTSACLGYGTCVPVCPTGALHLQADGLIAVTEDRCVGCGKCAKACPKKVFVIASRRPEAIALCRIPQRGKAVRDACHTGCTACSVCARKCPQGAIAMDKFLPVVDTQKCDACGVCVSACPTGAMRLPGIVEPA